MLETNIPGLLNIKSKDPSFLSAVFFTTFGGEFS